VEDVAVASMAFFRVRLDQRRNGFWRRALYEHIEACPFCNPNTAPQVIPE